MFNLFMLNKIFEPESESDYSTLESINMIKKI